MNQRGYTCVWGVQCKSRACALVVGLSMCLFLWNASSVRAQEGKPKEDRSIWAGVFLESRLPQIHNNLVFYLDFQVRFSKFGEQFSQGIFRPAIGYMLPYGFSVFLGYAWFANLIELGDPLESEHRIWQQLNWKWKFKKLALELYSRSRLEQRFITAAPDVSVRFRQYFRASWFFHPKSPIGIGLGDELFLSFNEVSWSQTTGFSQNRLIAALLLQIHSAWRFESGYMNQWVGGTNEKVNHVLFLRFFIVTG